MRVTAAIQWHFRARFVEESRTLPSHDPPD
jgi:hypothetical protein